MLNKLFVLIVVMGLGFNSFSQELSSKASVSVLTVEPGHEELFAAFGHSAIRIQDPTIKMDKVYNFGTYYYNQPYFYLNFARGYLLYGLSVSKWQRFQGYYAYFNRQVEAQYINLTLDQKQKVFDFLENNAKPENSMYYYDYFYDNCATRIRDVFESSLGENIKIPENYVSNPAQTVRQLTDTYIEEEFPWGKLGIDLCLGLPMDKQMTDYEYMYLPDYVYEAFKVSEIKSDSGWVNAVSETEIILRSRPADVPKTVFTPFRAFSVALFLGIMLLVIQLRTGRNFKLVDFILFFITGLIGLLLLLLWTVTDHNAAADNFNLLWALPTHLLVSFALFKRNTKRWVNWYIALLIPFSVLVLIFWKTFPQDLNVGFIPIVFLIIVRSIAITLRK